MLSCWLQIALSYGEFEVPDCLSFTIYGENFCNDNNTYEWCKWNDDYSICQVQKSLKVDAMTLNSFDLGVNLFWVIGIPGLYAILFQISKMIAYILLEQEKISKSYFEKCVIYIYEPIGMIPILFKIFSPVFVYDVIFNPNNYEHVKSDKYKQLYSSIQFFNTAIVSMYLCEITFANKMRWQLKTHHWTCITAS